MTNLIAGIWLLDDMGCQSGVESAKLTTVMKNTNETIAENYATIKLGIDAHAKQRRRKWRPC